MERRRLGHGQHPAHLAETLLGIDQVGHGDHVGFVLDHPVVTGQTGVENAVLDVARHLLRADQHALDFGVVDGREVTPARDLDVESGAPEQIDRRVLETAFRNAQLEYHALPPYTLFGSYVRCSLIFHSPPSSVRKKQLA